jgi:hypothetical protein
MMRVNENAYTARPGIPVRPRSAYVKKVLTRESPLGRCAMGECAIMLALYYVATAAAAATAGGSMGQSCFFTYADRRDRRRT